MAKPAKPRFDTNRVVTSSQLSALADLADYAADPPGAIARRVANQSIPSGTPTALQFDTEEFDNAAMFAPTSNIITIVDAGVYQLAGGCRWGTISGTGDRAIYLYHNGIEVDGGNNMSPSSTTQLPHTNASTAVLCNASDTIELRIYQLSGVAMNAIGRLSVIRVTGS